MTLWCRTTLGSTSSWSASTRPCMARDSRCRCATKTAAPRSSRMGSTKPPRSQSVRLSTPTTCCPYRPPRPPRRRPCLTLTMTRCLFSRPTRRMKCRAARLATACRSPTSRSATLARPLPAAAASRPRFSPPRPRPSWPTRLSVVLWRLRTRAGAVGAGDCCRPRCRCLRSLSSAASSTSTSTSPPRWTSHAPKPTPLPSSALRTPTTRASSRWRW
mmetsp:Transcript_25263/g.45071  ORF Transcript_25263/g.45071 Transcript_25263/m.45071 type:complete len:216 (-) Transcript_25263:256-903(-)